MSHRVVDAPNEDGTKRLVRGMWIWKSDALLEDDGQMDNFVRIAKDVNVTDVYLHVAPKTYEPKGDNIASFNTKLQSAGIRVWALDGDPLYISNQTAHEAFMVGLRDLINYNERVAPPARFHGLQAHIEPHDTPADQGKFHEGIAASELTEMQRTERDIRMHMWINCLTRASAFLHSYDLPFGAVMPYWLHIYEGEPITMPWSTGKQLMGQAGRTCMMDMVMPLVDQYVIRCCDTVPAEVVRRMMTQIRYASDSMLEGQKMPVVLGSLEAAEGGDTTETRTQKTVLEDLDRIEKVMAKYPAFGGMVIYRDADWEKLPP